MPHNRHMSRAARPALAVLLILLATHPLLAAGRQTASQPAPAPQKKEPPPVRTPYEAVPATDPRKEIIETVRGSAGYTSGMMGKELWNAGDYHNAWERTGQYFPGRVYFTTSREHFLTHFFNPLGYQEIEIFDSD
ncbi:MAG: hypothetical protein FJY79_10440, partial [Candidatus Aminicenantes bacterium]|nr:hypothetical protein [Candidatus Aminicenantes bacterium]